MADHPTVIQALAAVADDVRAVRKQDRNDHQKFSFRGIDSVLNAVGPAFRAHGVVCLPVTEAVDLDTVMTTGGKASTRALVRVRYCFYGPAGDSVEAVVTGESWDMGDKAVPKAYSVAYRTALLQTLTIPTDEVDPDAQTYERDSAAVRVTQRPLDVISEPERGDLIAMIGSLDPDGQAAYNDFRKREGIPSLKTGAITSPQADVIAAWYAAWMSDHPVEPVAAG